MTTLYTSTGEFIMRRNDGGHKCPVVAIAGTEYFLSIPEMILWTKGMWNICTYEKLEESFRQEEDILGNMAFSFTLNRLLQRGLMLNGEADTDTGALHTLLDKLTVKAADLSLSSRIKTFFIMLIRMSTPLSYAKMIFKKYDLTTDERLALSLAKDTDIAVSDLIAELSLEDTAALMLLSNLYLRKLVRFTERKSGVSF